MIIILSKNEINLKAAKQLALQSNAAQPENVMIFPDINFNGITDNQLTIIELSASLQEQELLNQAGAIELIQEKGGIFPNTVERIELIYSNVDREIGLAQQASNISFYFRQNFENREILVRHPKTDEYNYTFVVPPHLTEDKNWHIHGFDEEELTAYIKENQSSEDDQNSDKDDDSQFDTFLEFVTDTKRAPIWKGPNIRDFLARPSQSERAYPVSYSPVEKSLSNSSDSVKQHNSLIKDSTNGKKRAHSPDSASSSSASFWSSNPSDSTVVSPEVKEQFNKVLDSVGSNPQAWAVLEEIYQQKKKMALKNGTNPEPTHSN